MRRGVRSEDPEVMEKVARLKRDGVIDSDLTSEMIMRNINTNGKNPNNPFTRVYRGGMERLSGWYSTPDTYAKLVGHEVELRALKKIFPKKSDDELFDMASERIKNVMLHDQDIIDRRWAECEKCEFLTPKTKQCQKCNCFMAVAHKLKGKYCPVGKWDKYTEKAIHGTYATN